MKLSLTIRMSTVPTEKSMGKSHTSGKSGQAVLERDRLKSAPAASLVDSAFTNELKQQLGLFSAMGLVDLAYTITGINTGIIPAREGSDLLAKLLELHSRPDSFTPGPEAGDLYTNREAWLRQQTETAGWLGAGRARREATTSAFHVLLRRRLLELLASLAQFGQALKQRAGDFKQAYVPDYTYLQAAQPTTFGHYLAGFLYPVFRDCERIQQLYRRVNSSPMGCGSTTGSRLAVDRRQMADLLGFDALSIHTRDAMWQPDIPIESAAVFCSCAVNMSRLAEDLQIFSSQGFVLVELADQHARASRIMPQKKNPFALTHVRSVCNELMGLMTSVNAMARTPTGQPDNRLWIYGAVPDAVSNLVNAVYLMTDVVLNMELKHERARELLDDPSIMATDLAETLVLRGKIDYRSAYELVASLFHGDTEGGIKNINASILKQAAAAVLGREISISDEDIKQALDPGLALEAHTEPGTPALGSMDEMLEGCEEKLQLIGENAEQGKQRLLRIEKQLLDTARQYPG